jgi:hypothetical protein
MKRRCSTLFFPRAGTNIEAVGEGRTIASSQGEFSDDFAPLSEHVYRLEL